MKKITLSLLALICGLFCFQTALATELNTEDVYLLGNCKSSDMSKASVYGLNDGKIHTFAGASLLDINTLKAKGTHVVGIRVLVGASITSGKVFLGTNYENPLIEKTFLYKQGGWQYVLFNEPYEIGTDSVYIGLEIKGSGSILAMEKIGTSYDSEKMKIDNNAWTTVAQANLPGHVWMIQAIVAGGDYSAEVQRDAVIDNIAATKSAKAGEKIAVAVAVRNAGIKPLVNPRLAIEMNGEKDTVMIEEKLLNGQSTVFQYNNLVAPDLESAFTNLKINVSVVDEADENMKNNTKTVAVRLFSSKAVKRNKMLIEQFTGQGCGYCPGGAEVLKNSIEGMKNPENVIWVAHHAGYAKDDFTLSESLDIAASLRVPGAPNCVVDRMEVDYASGQTGMVWHPGYSTSALLEKLADIPGVATMELTANYTEENRQLVVGVKGQLLVPSAKLTMLIKQSGMIAKQASAGSKYEHNNAPRMFLTASRGEKLEVDSAGNYEISYVVNIPVAVGKFACEGKMDVVAFLHGDINNTASSLVYNADEASFNVQNATDVENSYVNGMTIYPNPTTDMLYIDGLTEGDMLKVYTIDGMLVKEQEVVNVNEPLNVCDMPQGTYFLHVNRNIVKFVKK